MKVVFKTLLFSVFMLASTLVMAQGSSLHPGVQRLVTSYDLDENQTQKMQSLYERTQVEIDAAASEMSEIYDRIKAADGKETASQTARDRERLDFLSRTRHKLNIERKSSLEYILNEEQLSKYRADTSKKGESAQPAAKPSK